MRISKVAIPQDTPCRDGLDAIEMDGLGQVVILAGRNGSGKSLILKKIKSAFLNQPTRQMIDQTTSSVAQFENARIRIDEMIRKLESTISVLQSHDDPLQQEVAPLKEQQQHLIERIEKEKSTLKSAVLTIEGDQSDRHILQFVPTQISLSDPRDYTLSQLQEQADLAVQIGISHLATTALAKIQYLQDEYWQATHPTTETSPEEKDAITRDYNNLQMIIEQLLGERLSRNQQRSATLFGLPIGKAKLSNGQKLLLQMAVAIHCQVPKLDGTVLILDDPENHLHPSAVIEVIETLRSQIPSGQIWIATHSISIISHFADGNSLWYVDEGKLSLSGEIEKNVLCSLLGDDKQIAEQSRFLEKPDHAAVARYTSRLIHPVSNPDQEEADPKIAKIHNAITKFSGSPLRVLDYGTTKGEILAHLIDNFELRSQLTHEIDYTALTSPNCIYEACEYEITRTYNTSNNRLFDNQESVLQSQGKEAFHLIVMNNVLRSISPAKWSSLFGSKGVICKLLAPKGFLLIVEDERVVLSDNAQDSDYLVLDTPSISTLFGIGRGHTRSVHTEDLQGAGRIKAHFIPRDYLLQYTKKTKKAAIERHQEIAKKAISGLQKSGGEGEGTLLSFWLHQYAIASLNV